MIPSVVARQLKDALIDYIMATLDFDDPGFAAAFQAALEAPDGLFRGPYLRLGLPFASADPDAAVSLTVAPPFTPYRHQLQAFRQLRSDAPTHNTLVTTGTGSGKTECFLYPILDHCHRHRGPGVKAIVVYPMNALATDQARRFAAAVHADPRLHGLRVGLYVGGEGVHTQMAPDHVIEHKKTLREEPPDVLLTNYKMLDFMLVRPDERGLWRHNAPETLRYLIIDELHTFDGAQGSDVACLVRRLKSRLQIPEGHLACCGTSATIGSSSDPETFSALADFAAEIFEEPFDADGVVREIRQPRADFLLPPEGAALPARVDPYHLDPENVDGTERWLDLQQRIWLEEVVPDPLALGRRLRAHPLLGRLLEALEGRPLTLEQLDAVWADPRKGLEGWSRHPQPVRLRLLESFLALVSRARRQVGDRVMPLLTLQVQLWTRELTRLLRSLPEQSDGALKPPRFHWWTDAPGASGPEGLYAPQARCRECGVTGFAAVQTELDRQQGQLTFTPSTVGQAWFINDRDARFVWPRPLDPAEREGELNYWLSPTSGALRSKPLPDEDGPIRACPVVLEQTLRGEANPRFAARCPGCNAEDSLRIVGSRAASLTSVVVTQLFQSPYNEDKKLLAFTDSVQDACHRAGFFGGRAYRIHLRTAIQAVINANPLLPLDRAAQAFEDYWRQELGELAYVANFLPADLRELPAYQKYVEKKGKGKHQALWRTLRERLSWEITREFGLAAGIGRSLERSAASAASFEPEALAVASQRFTAWLDAQGRLGPAVNPGHFLLGLLHRMRNMGAIFHPFLDRYAKNDGNRYLLSKRQNPNMSPVGPRSKRIRFLSSRAGRVFPSPYAERGWYSDWLRRALDWPEATPDELVRAYREALAGLVEAKLVEERSAARREQQIWGIRPEAVRLSSLVSAAREGVQGRVLHLGIDEARAVDGQLAWTFRSRQRFHMEMPKLGYYQALYSRGATTRVFSSEHTGLLERGPRTELERRFIDGATPEDPQAPNLLVATPTLEMGVDIGDLSAALLCSVPPTPANYLQRIGRAGRATGNALVFVMANAQPHDLYFHAEPLEMLDGAVLPPGIFLGATAMLRRQLSAWCMDRWARDDADAEPVPRRSGLVLSTGGRKRFPGRFQAYVRDNRAELLQSFQARFHGSLSPDSRDQLQVWLNSDHYGVLAAFDRAFDDLQIQIKAYQSDSEKARKRLKAIEEDPTAVADAEGEARDLKRYRAVLAELIRDLRDKYPLNVLAEASLLPNYAFPEAGIQLHSLLGAARDEGEDKRRYEKREYTRPAARALRELAPFNTFYAEGHKVQVRQLELGPKAALVQHWRFCPSCHHVLRAVDPTEVITEPCPRCGDADWKDQQSQVRAMLPMSTVRSVSDLVRSTTTDDTEEREEQSYQVHQLFEVRPEHLDGEAVVLPELGFGFEYLKQVALTEVNVGLKLTAVGAARVEIAGQSAPEQGFPTCLSCGTVRDPRSQPGARFGPPEHTPFCPRRGDDNAPKQPLYLFREVTSEAVRFLLPFSEIQLEPKLYSFMAALNFGLRRRFKGRPIHLQVTTMSEPVDGERHRRKYFLVLFDVVPGGTGYLREYRQRRAVFKLLEETLEGLRRCPCRERGRDGCYLCLFAHQSRRHLPVLSRRLAERLLDDIVRARHTAETSPGGLSATRVDSVLESELEEKFIATLSARFGKAFVPVDGGVAWELRAGETVWRLDGQVDMSQEAGQPCRADFVFRGVQGPGLEQRVVVECDGFAYHALPGRPHGRVGEDVRKRRRMAGYSGLRVFTITWQDLEPKRPAISPPELLAQVPPGIWGSVLKAASAQLSEGAHAAATRLPTLGPLELLLAYLENPGPHWEQAIGVRACAALATAARGNRLLSDADRERVLDHLRVTPTLAPLPLHVLGGPPRSGLLSSVSLQGDCALALSGHSSVMQNFNGGGIEGVLRLDDQQERRDSAGFVEDWRRFLHGLNLAQFLPGLDTLTTEGRGVQYADPEISASLAAAPGAFTSRRPPRLEVLLRDCLDDEVRALVQAIYDRGLPLPDEDEFAATLPGDAPAELTWGDRRVAVVREEDLEPVDLKRAREAGWRLHLLPVELDELARHLGATGASTT